VSHLFERVRDQNARLEERALRPPANDRLCSEAGQFIFRACNAGAWISENSERKALRDLATNWALFLSGQGKSYPETELASWHGDHTPKLQELAIYYEMVADKYSKWRDPFYMAEAGFCSELSSTNNDAQTDVQQKNLSLLQALRASPRLLVLGRSGIGKTTSLERLALEYGQQGITARFPVLVPLGSYQQEAIYFASKDELQQTLQFDQLVCHFLLDGLHELSESQQKQALVELCLLMKQYSRHYYAVTSRPDSAHAEELHREMRVVSLQPIDGLRMHKYLLSALGDQDGERIYKALGRRMRAIARIPLFLQFLVSVARETGEDALPQNRGQLLHRVLTLWMRRDQKCEIPEDIQFGALAQLAYTMFSKRRNHFEATAEEAEEVFSRYLARYPQPPCDCQRLIAEAKANNLLIGRKNLVFWHESFQALFAALALQDQLEYSPDPDLRKSLSQRLSNWRVMALANQPQWGDCFIFLAGIHESPWEVINEIVGPNPWLARWCLDEASASVDRTQVSEARRWLHEMDDQVESKTTKMLLSRSGAAERRAALKKLADTLNPEALAKLVPCLADPDAEFRKIAIEGLVDLSGHDREEVESRLLEVLWTDQVRTRRAASIALGRIWGMPAVEGLGADDPEVQRRAADAFILKCLPIEQPKHLYPLIALLKEQTEAKGRSFGQWQAAPYISRAGKVAEKPLMDFLSSCTAGDRWAALDALAQIPDIQLTGPLRQLMEDTDHQLRRAAINALGRSWGLDLLCQLASDNPRNRSEAARQLGQHPDDRALLPLHATLADENEQVRCAVADTLGVLNKPMSVEPLRRVLKDSQPAVRSASALALGKLKEDKAAAPLTALLEDGVEGVREAALDALVFSGPMAVPALVGLLGISGGYSQQLAILALSRIGDSAVEALAGTLTDQRPLARWAAARALGRMGSPRATKPLLSALADEEFSVRDAAAQGLVRIGPAAVSDLSEALKHQRDANRQMITETLGRIGGPEATLRLTELLADEDPQTRRAAIDSLGRIGASAISALINALSQSDWQTRAGAVDAIVRIGEPAVERIAALLTEETGDLHAFASQALQRIGDPAVSSLIALLYDDNSSVRQGAVQILGRIRSARSLQPLGRVAAGDRDKQTRLLAIRALGAFSDSRAAGAALPLLADPDEMIREASAQALSNLLSSGQLALLQPYLAHADPAVRATASRVVKRIGESSPPKKR
jgi:HEAT repeat protein